MKLPSKKLLERIVQRHTGRRRRISKEASSLIFLHHVIFMKKLAKACDNVAFRQRKMQITEEDVEMVSPRLLTTFCEGEKIRLRAQKSASSRKRTKSTNASWDVTSNDDDDDDDDDDDKDDDEADEPEEISEGDETEDDEREDDERENVNRGF
ncbi:trigger factor-like [Homarus americanus]|uniref:trigger factor-like n=1 Tax=Homarus americanus TaxID=6706 RepID=UPI001C48469C|nr:trigger factor-like [Homarus americanus]